MMHQQQMKHSSTVSSSETDWTDETIKQQNRQIRKIHVTGHDFPKHSSSEGAPSDCSDEAWPSHSMAVEDEEDEVNLLAA